MLIVSMLFLNMLKSNFYIIFAKYADWFIEQL